MSLGAKALAITCAALCAPICVTAAAQDTGHLIERYPRAAIDEYAHDRRVAARRVMLDYGRCVLKYSPRAAEAWLLITPGSEAASKKGRDLAVEDCLVSGEVRFSLSLFRGALYAARYQDRYRSILPGNLSKGPEPALWSVDLADAQQVTELALVQVGVCVARSSSEAAHMLTLSVAGTRAETDAIASLTPMLAACLPGGREFHFSKDVMRAAVAEGIYRLRAAAEPQIAH